MALNERARQDAMKALERNEKIPGLAVEILLSDIRQDRQKSRVEFNNMFDAVQTGNKTQIDWSKCE